jgi:hypothetical protein
MRWWDCSDTRRPLYVDTILASNVPMEILASALEGQCLVNEVTVEVKSSKNQMSGFPTQPSGFRIAFTVRFFIAKNLGTYFDRSSNWNHLPYFIDFRVCYGDTPVGPVELALQTAHPRVLAIQAVDFDVAARSYS